MAVVTQELGLYYSPLSFAVGPVNQSGEVFVGEEKEEEEEGLIFATHCGG